MLRRVAGPRFTLLSLASISRVPRRVNTWYTASRNYESTSLICLSIVLKQMAIRHWYTWTLYFYRVYAHGYDEST